MWRGFVKDTPTLTADLLAGCLVNFRLFFVNWTFLPRPPPIRFDGSPLFSPREIRSWPFVRRVAGNLKRFHSTPLAFARGSFIESSSMAGGNKTRWRRNEYFRVSKSQETWYLREMIYYYRIEKIFYQGKFATRILIEINLFESYNIARAVIPFRVIPAKNALPRHARKEKTIKGRLKKEEEEEAKRKKGKKRGGKRSSKVETP